MHSNFGQFTEHVAEWVRVLEEKRKVQSAQLGPIESKRADGKGHRPEGGARAASRTLHLERKVVDRALKIAGITPAAKEAARTAGLEDNQGALLKIAEAAPERQPGAQGSFMRLGAL